MMWDTPEVLHLLMTSQHEAQEPVAEERGYIVEKQNAIIQIRIPYNAEGAIRKKHTWLNALLYLQSLVSGDLFEFYIFDLYLEQMSFGETRWTPDFVLTGHWLRPCCHAFSSVKTVRTVPEERVFTVYLGDVPEDVELAAVHLNGQKCKAPFTNESSLTITNVIQPNNNHGYTLKVSMFDPVIRQKFSKEDAAMQHTLEINYTLTVLPENEPFYHLASVMAFTDVSPPVFDAVCTESGISFKLDHRPFDYLWEITIDSDLLTRAGRTARGFNLKGFIGTFKILIRNPETSEVQSSAIKTCSFTTTELISKKTFFLFAISSSGMFIYLKFALIHTFDSVSTDGRMTVVADLALAIPNGAILLEPT
ncbi:hypothetical protein F7725_004568 [Dissostichus mawsoni]|uniref:ZP-domain containing protein Ig-like domain-containing protein n=1 Tax=Dissostichus mawsoni TaxID=36200 RepID=A0A7J5XJ63_DISMA|nr:hypothetical protein F7725_004568 [Dissostichus mawsoni]